MMNEKIGQAFNEQIKHEFESEHLYLSMAAWFCAQGLDGMAGWMRAQALEERSHAMKFFGHLEERGGRVHLQALSQPKAEWPSPLEAFKDAYKHEQFVTGKINALMKLAGEQADYAATTLLHWFVDEQVEEESSTAKIVQMLERIGSSGAGLVMLDRQLGKREAKA